MNNRILDAIGIFPPMPQERKTTILPEAQIMELRAAVARYEQDCPFKVGDLVTPRANSPYRNKGGIHIVVEAFTDSPVRDRTTSSGDWPHYGKLDMRILYIADNGDTVPHMVESWLFEPYTGESATAQPEPAEATSAAPDWISWSGGEWPVDPTALVEVEIRDGKKMVDKACAFRWSHEDAGGDIMRYRVIF